MPNSALRPTTSGESRSAPDMEASISASISQSRDIELWLSSNGKAMRRPLSWRGWQTRPWVKRLSGTILDPSTADRGAAGFISSLPAIPASHSATPACDRAPPILDTCGRKSPASWGRPLPNGSGSKTSRGTCPWDVPTSCETFAKWATRQRRACLRREKRAQVTGAAACSSWPTPTATDGGYFPELEIAAGDIAIKSPAETAPGSAGQYPLSNSARVWMLLWLTLRALGWSARTATFQSSPPVRLSFTHGSSSYLATLKPNPRFYELVMGWPIDWTAPGEQATGYAAWLQRSRGQFSNLLITSRAGHEDVIA